jgi:hypothetical protein
VSGHMGARDSASAPDPVGQRRVRRTRRMLHGAGRAVRPEPPTRPRCASGAPEGRSRRAATTTPNAFTRRMIMRMLGRRCGPRPGWPRRHSVRAGGSRPGPGRGMSTLRRERPRRGLGRASICARASSLISGEYVTPRRTARPPQVRGRSGAISPLIVGRVVGLALGGLGNRLVDLCAGQARRNPRLDIADG